MKSIINIITQLLAYSDDSHTDNPQKRDFDWSRRFHAIPVSNPAHDKVVLPPGESVTLFDGIRSTGLTTSSVMSIAYVRDSIYRLTVSTPSAFRTSRVITGITGCVVTVNNNVVASFQFTGASITASVGDILRIAGSNYYDTFSNYSFSPLNAGKWRVVSVSGDTIQAVRSSECPFSGINETVVTVDPAQVEIYSASGVQAGDKFEISGVFSPASWRTYEVLDARPTQILFTSAINLPEESGLTFTVGSVVFYSDAKKMIYVEVDQDSVIQFNNDSSQLNRITPIQPGKSDLVGYFHKYGISYKAVVINKSINIANVRFFTAE
jgi:hypothetical protein